MRVSSSGIPRECRCASGRARRSIHAARRVRNNRGPQIGGRESAGAASLSTRVQARHLFAAKVVAAAALAGLVAGSLAIVVAAARGPSILAPPLKHDMNGWLTGPFNGIWPGRFDPDQSLQ